MWKFLRPLTSIRRFLSMETEEDVLYYSQEKFYNVIANHKDKNVGAKEYLKGVKYPSVQDFKQGLEWFNVSEPISAAQHLKGKIVILDFFCYCCINCMHILPDLREIEKEYPIEKGLVVIGVHSAKFENEKISKNILSAVQRYNIAHPVVNDFNSEMWKNCDVHCWPTLLVMGPNFNPLVMFTGEGHKQDLKLIIQNAIEYYNDKKMISQHALPIKSAYHLLPNNKGPLLFPGKISSVLNSENEEMLAISDTGNNRILVVNTEGTILYQIGGKKLGFKDGSLDDAEFNNPQGISFLNEHTLIVADTENHAIRRVDLRERCVKTLAGTGSQGHDRTGGKLWTWQAISSPWDVAVYRTKESCEVILIAMAGSHQIWALFLQDTVWWKNKEWAGGSCVAIAGSGREENRNNSYPNSAAFAQPSGVAVSQKTHEVFVADSESSSVRRLSLLDGKVTPVVGGDRNPNNLFAFGDKDGKLYEAKLQHALGVGISNDGHFVFVADTYNHKLKKIAITDNEIITLQNAKFDEPGGVCASLKNENQVFVADTNNHTIKKVLFDNGTIINIANIELNTQNEETDNSKVKSKILLTNPVKISNNGGKLTLNTHITYQNGLKLTEDAPQKWVVNLPDAMWSSVPKNGDNLKDIQIIVSVPLKKNINEKFVDIFFDIITCTDDSCLPKTFTIRIPVVYGNSGTATHVLYDVNINIREENEVLL